MIQNHIIN